MPTTVEQRDEMRHGIIMLAGFADLKRVLSPIVVVGIICTLVEFKIIRVIIAFVINPEPSSMPSMAFIPLGVQAFPMPSRFAEMFWIK